MDRNQAKSKDTNPQHKDEEKSSTFVEPKLSFIQPELEKQGSLENLTKQGFFGVFPGQGS
jgi:hypothetical protein